MTGPFSMRMGRQQKPPALKGNSPIRLRTSGSWTLSRALRDAQTALDNGEGAAAVGILEPLRAKFPTSPHLLIHLGRAYAAAGNLDAATEALFKAKEHSANSPIVDLFFGQAYLWQDRAGDAETSFRRALDASPKNPLIANYVALSLFRQGRYSEAFRIWKTVGWSQNREFLVEFTILLERFLMVSPEDTAPPPIADAPPIHRAALAAHGEGRLAEWRRGARVRGLLGQAERLLASQKTTEALQTAQAALALSPDSHPAMLLEAVANYELGRHREAARRLLRILAEEPTTLARCFLAYCLLRLGELELAEAMLARIIPEGPYDYYLHYHLGLCALIRGDRAGARRLFGIAYRDFFVDSREYCFEYLIQKARGAVQRLTAK